MKKLFILFAGALICGAGAFTSCKKDSEPDVPAALLVKTTGVTATKTYHSDYTYDDQGRFKKGVDDEKERSFEYDRDGHLIKDATLYTAEGSSGSQQEFEWKDGDLFKHTLTMQFGSIHSTATTEYVYGEKPYQLHPQDGFVLWNGIVFTRALGKMPVHQPVSCTVTTVRNINGKISTVVKTRRYDYSYDANSRIVRVDIFVNEDPDPDTRLTFVWSR